MYCPTVDPSRNMVMQDTPNVFPRTPGSQGIYTGNVHSFLFVIRFNKFSWPLSYTLKEILFLDINFFISFIVMGSV